MISDKDISIVMQGPVIGQQTANTFERVTYLALQSIRCSYPQAEIILSTWEHSNLDDLDFDIIIENKDPGSLKAFRDRDCNVNRQIVTTHSGINRCTRPYCVKLRTDCSIYHQGLINCLELANIQPALPHQIFEKPIVISELGSVSPLRCSRLFHPSDIFQAGKTVDMQKLWDTPFETELETLHWHKHVRRRRFLVPANYMHTRHMPEQHIWISCLQKAGIKIDIKHFEDFPRHMIILSERYLAANFNIYSASNLGFAPSSHLWNQGQAVQFFQQNEFQSMHELCINNIPDTAPQWTHRVRSCLKNHHIRQIQAFLIHNLMTRLLRIVGHGKRND
ncbi:MAG: hypothetical protein CMJ19_03085 [Phycisphaeraceae bacterium]|nr:hypothetical protein [Phycisphaeraceae bacterium]|tara:strand:- start:110 stop:1114 length:1005 start_codon:yes stop_codon:yes gene_type:complete